MSANILICGLVRNEQKLKEKLEIFCQLRDEGIVEKIVFSTWIGEIEKYPGLGALLKKSNVILVQSEEPTLVVCGHRFHQMKAFYYGLQLFEEDDLIFKCRTELGCYDPTMRQYFTGEISLKRKSDNSFSVLSERVVVDYAQFLYPFLMGDAQFFGRKRDIKQFVNMDYFYDIAFNDVAVEQTFFSKPFIEKFPILGLHYFWNLPQICQANTDPENQIAYLLDSDYFLDLLATYHQILYANFIVGWEPKDHYESAFIEEKFGSPALVDIKQLVDRKNPPYGIIIRHEGSIGLHSNTTIELFANGFLKDSVLSCRYEDALKRTQSLDYQNTYTMNPATVPASIRAFYREFETRYPKQFYEAKIFNEGKDISQENHINARANQCYVINKEDENLLRYYQDEVTALRRINSEMNIKMQQYALENSDSPELIT